jgi:putative transposase
MPKGRGVARSPVCITGPENLLRSLRSLHFGESFSVRMHHFGWGRRFRLPLSAMPEYRRKLPHFHPDGACLFLTWRLWGSLPAKGNLAVYSTAGQAFVATDRELDKRASGPLWLGDPRIADLVCQAILIGDCERHFYDLGAWAVMPNHVHLLIIPKVPVPVLMRWLKGSTARNANRILGRTGQSFWQDESYDHYLRNRDQINRTIAYIEENPVSAGFVCSAERWPWSSAGWQAKPPAPPNLSPSPRM